MFNTNFGIEIEMTGITRSNASKVVAEYLGGVVVDAENSYYTYKVKAQDGRLWTFTRDGSIDVRRNDGTLLSDAYSTELVSPILNYDKDIETLQEIIRVLRRNGACVNESCGIHIHLDGKGHTAQTIKNFVNLIYARNDLFYDALAVNERRKRFCKRLDEKLVSKLDRMSNPTLEEIENAWYEESDINERRDRHYNSSRYHFLNLHSFFHGHGTIELRGFNSTLHAGIIRSYICLALALNNQALTAKFISKSKPQVENQKFAMRIYLNRIGLVGEEFKNVRKHLLENLKGNSAWRFKEAA